MECPWTGSASFAGSLRRGVGPIAGALLALTALIAGLLASSTPAYGAMVQATETCLADAFPRTTNGEGGISLQYRDLDGSYHDLANAADYLFWTPGTAWNLPLVHLFLATDPATGIPAGSIQAHPSAVNQVGWKRDPVIRVTLDGNYGAVRVRGEGAKAAGSMRFYIYQGEGGYAAPLWQAWDGGAFDLTIPYAAGDQLLFAVDAGPDDVSDWSYWRDIRFQGSPVCQCADLTPPRVTGLQPGAGAEGVPLTRVISAQFAEPLDAATLDASTFVLRDSTGSAVPATVSYSAASCTAVLTPIDPLAAHTTYTAMLTGAVADEAGNGMGSGYSWSFTTGGAAFAESFSDPARVAANWSPYGSAFSVSGGVGTLWPDGSVIPVVANFAATIHDKGEGPIVFGDLSYGVDVKMTAARRTMLCFGSGLGSGAESWRFWVGYDIASAMITCYNGINWTSRSAGTFTLLDDYRPYDGLWHHWQVEVKGSACDFYVDNHHVLTGQLAGYLPGQIGMKAWDAGGSQFDNVMASRDMETAPPVSNEAPICHADSYGVDAGGVLAIAAPGVLSNDTDPDGDILSVAPAGCPTNGALVLNSDGSFTYRPNAGFSGVDSFTYAASDGRVESNAVTVEFTVLPRDTNPPVLELPSDMVVEATAAEGAIVSYAVSAVDDVDGPVAVASTPPSGSVFALGTTTVVCSAQDVAGNTAAGSFTVAVRDTTPPLLTVPADVSVSEVDPSGTVVEIGMATANDLVDPAPQISNDAPAAFPTGVTAVTWTATDASGNVATGVQTVTVVPSRCYANFAWVAPMANADKRLFRRGSTIPVKFAIIDLQGAPATSATATLAIYYLHDGAPEGEPLEVSTASGDEGDQFRHTGDGQYLFNLSTKPPEWYSYCTFLVQVTLDDGQVFSQPFSLK